MPCVLRSMLCSVLVFALIDLIGQKERIHGSRNYSMPNLSVIVLRSRRQNILFGSVLPKHDLFVVRADDVSREQ